MLPYNVFDFIFNGIHNQFNGHCNHDGNVLKWTQLRTINVEKIYMGKNAFHLLWVIADCGNSQQLLCTIESNKWSFLRQD